MSIFQLTRQKKLTGVIILGFLLLLFLPQAAMAGEVPVAGSLEELGLQIDRHLKDGEDSFSVRYTGDTALLKNGIDKLMEDIIFKDDYLHYILQNYSYKYRGYPGNVLISFSFSFTETKEQRDFVNAATGRILAGIISADMSEYQKEKAIHDYIVLNVAYDTSLTENTAYAALTKGKAVCQGYALLAHKMFSMAGLESRIIEGDARGPHMWNMVKIDGNWYHLDITWDDPVPDLKGKVFYNYFNLTDEKIKKDHSWPKIYPLHGEV